MIQLRKVGAPKVFPIFTILHAILWGGAAVLWISSEVMTVAFKSMLLVRPKPFSVLYRVDLDHSFYRNKKKTTGGPER